ncbi:hypothetical protein [Labilibaculum euxinus]
MEFQHDKSWDCLERIFTNKMTAKEAWNQFINFHEQMYPKSYWTDLRNLDIEDEQNDIISWIHQLVTDSPLPENVQAIWIGILRLEDNGNEIPAIYMVGADTYNKNDIDWACEPSYMPENRYVLSGILKEIDDIIKTDDDNYEFLDWILPLTYCALTFDEIIRTRLDKKLFLSKKDKIFVATGHDSGDYLDLSNIE